MSDFGETTFQLKDVIMLVGGIISLAGTFFALKYAQKASDKDIQGLKEEIVSAKRGRHSMRKEISEDMEKRETIIMKRIDKTQAEQKEYVKSTNEEFKDINNTISQVKQDTSEIKGMVQTLLTQKK